MYRLGILYSLSPTVMYADGFNHSEVSRTYQVEIPKALALCGFTERLQRTIYATCGGVDFEEALRRLEEILPVHAPNLCRYATRVHVFRFDDWTDITAQFATFGEPGGAEREPAGETRFTGLVRGL